MCASEAVTLREEKKIAQHCVNEPQAGSKRAECSNEQERKTATRTKMNKNAF